MGTLDRYIIRQFLGTFSLDSLPLYSPDFPWNGGDYDAVKVCFLTPTGA